MLQMQAVQHSVVAVDMLVQAVVAEVGNLQKAEAECMHRPLADPGKSEATVEVFIAMEQAAELISPNGQ